jgi:S1-C subfamily serine protease
MKPIVWAAFATMGYSLFLSAAIAQPAVERLERQLRERQRGEEDLPDDAGYLGVFALERAAGAHGVELKEVMADGPADKAGLEPGDVVTKIGDQSIRDLNDFAAALEDQPVGKKLRFAIERGGEPKQADVTLTARPPKPSRRYPNFGRVDEGGVAPPRTGVLGVRVEPVDEEVAEAAGSPVSHGALVVSVADDSPAARAGIPVQAVIVSVNGREIQDPTDLKHSIAANRPGQEMKVGFYHRGKLIERRVRLADVIPTDPAPALDVGPEESPNLPARPLTDKQRIEQLERRIQALEARLSDLERVLAGR